MLSTPTVVCPSMSKCLSRVNILFEYHSTVEVKSGQARSIVIHIVMNWIGTHNNRSERQAMNGKFVKYNITEALAMFV